MRKIINIVALIIAISAIVVVASATSNTHTVTNTEGFGAFHVLTIDDSEQAFCVQMHAKHPVTGVEYVATEYNIDGIDKVFIAIETLKNDSYDFRAAAQVAIWSTIENQDLRGWLLAYVKTQESVQFYEEIMENAKTVETENWNVNITYMYAEGYQILATADVVPRMTVPAPVVPEEVIPEITIPEATVPEETIPEVTVPEETVPEETVPETTVPEVIIPEIPAPPAPTTPPAEVPEEIIPEVTVPETIIPETTPETVPELDPEILADEPYYPSAPQTGDNSNLGLWTVMLVLSAIAIVALLAMKAKKQ